MPGLERQAEREKGIKSSAGYATATPAFFLQRFSSACGDILQLRFNFKPSIFKKGTMEPWNKKMNSMQSDKANGSYHGLSKYYLHLQMNYTRVHNTEDCSINIFIYPC